MIQLSNKMLEKYNYQIDFSKFLEDATITYISSELNKFLAGERKK